jgi:3-deoxy-D-manno-octulosonate 8-phosphate phosphatase (KDO 8-P phosphatase)
MDRTGLMQHAARVQLLLSDVDGTLTDGFLYYVGEEVGLRFSVRDGLGLVMARRAGLVTGVVSMRGTPSVRHRAEDLRLDEVHLAVDDKASVLREILARRAIPREAACYIGDDLNDLPAFAEVGLSVAVADAAEEVRHAAAFVTGRPGGAGAVREVVDLLLAARAGREPSCGS